MACDKKTCKACLEALKTLENPLAPYETRAKPTVHLETCGNSKGVRIANGCIFVPITHPDPAEVE